MPIPILMPALSPTMTEGKLAAWLKHEGDEVGAGDVIAEIETDKATMEVEAVDEGRLGKILIAAGSEGVAVNTPIALLLADGEDASAIGDAEVTSPPAPAPAPAAAEAPSTGVTASPGDLPVRSEPSTGGGRIFASPLARRMAQQTSLDLATISGTGPHGRIVKADIERTLAEGPQRPAAPIAPPVRPAEPLSAGGFREVPLSTMRKVIAERLTQSKQQIPHFYLALDVELDALLDLRKKLNGREAADYKLSVNDLVVKAAALATRAKPEVNAQWGGDQLIMLEDIDISVAVAIDGGLITPIVRHADRKSVVEISGELKDLVLRAKAGKLQPHEFQGGGLSISNLGMYGIESFQAVINPPQACILAVGAGTQRPVVRDGALTIATMMTVNLSVDHRVVDGALAAEWLQAFKRNIEDPLALLL